MNAACSEIKSSLKFSSLAEDNSARHAKMLSRNRGSRKEWERKLAKSKHFNKVEAEQNTKKNLTGQER